MKKKIALIIITILLVLTLGWLILKTTILIATPIGFENQEEERREDVIKQLKEIRTAERQYKLKYGRFTADFDSLINFVLEGTIEYDHKKIDENDVDALEAAKAAWEKQNPGKKFQNIEKRTYSVKDSIFKHLTPAQIKDLRYVPHTDKSVEFELEAGSIVTESKVAIPVVECRVLYKKFLDTTEYRQNVINFIDDLQKKNKYPGLKFGDMTKGSNEAGNWEE